ncbi:leucine-rich repeat protein [Phocaeicola plebeius]|uniref:leucine-rich repeat protein n=1 Tax=Phocaeicola plebeius TaxID=310297 RepID=UPI0026EF39ED|nr:leucine-rich repeat protein [Phocaeicola plebeius]
MKKKFIGTGTIRKVWIACSMVCACMFGLSSCGDDYDDSELRGDIENLEGRITALEEWQKSVNTDIRSLQSLVAALEDKDYVTAVTPLEDGTGYVISFLKSGNVTIKHGERGEQGEKGEDGTTPVISMKLDTDGKYYWTVNGEWLLDNGNKIPVTGEKGDKGDTGSNGLTPYIGDNGNWWIGTTDIGVKAQGDAIFAKDGIDYTSDPDNVIFTLADGTKVTLPRTSALTVGFDSYETFMLTLTTNVIDIILPETLKEEDYTALVAEVKNEAGVGMDIQTRAASSPWQVEVTKPTFINGKYQNNAKVTVTATGANNGDKAILKITLIDNKGQEISASRVLEYFDGAIVNISEGGLSNALIGISHSDIHALKVTGTLNETDFNYIRENLTALEVLDLSGANMTAFPNRGLAFYSTMGLSENTTLKKVVLPEGLETIGNSAFAMCSALEEINIPSTVTQLGRWILEGCKSLKTINIPTGVTTIPESCFYNAGLTSIDIPASVTTIGNWAFDNCPLEKVVIPSSVTSLGEPLTPPDGNYTFGSSMYYDDNSVAQLTEVEINANVTEIPDCCFAYQARLTKVTIPAGVKRIGSDAFNGCPITDVTLPENLEVIGARAFAYAKFTSLSIPSKVTTIGNSAFNGCKIILIDLPATIASLHATAFNWEDATIVICRATTVPETPQTDEFNNSWRPFYQINENCVLKVPAESLEAYKNAWGQYFKSVETIQE